MGTGGGYVGRVRWSDGVRDVTYMLIYVKFDREIRDRRRVTRHLINLYSIWSQSHNRSGSTCHPKNMIFVMPR